MQWQENEKTMKLMMGRTYGLHFSQHYVVAGTNIDMKRWHKTQYSDGQNVLATLFMTLCSQCSGSNKYITQQDIMMGASYIVHSMMQCQEQICDNMTQRLYMGRTYTLFIVYKFTVGGKNWKDVDRNTIIV